jgi:hypothetical protein
VAVVARMAAVKMSLARCFISGFLPRIFCRSSTHSLKEPRAGPSEP